MCDWRYASISMIRMIPMLITTRMSLIMLHMLVLRRNDTLAIRRVSTILLVVLSLRIRIFDVFV